MGKSKWQSFETAPRDGSPFLAWDGVGILLGWYTGVGFDFYCHDGDEYGDEDMFMWRPLPRDPSGRTYHERACD